MYITDSFIGIKKESLNHLFFYLSEDYAEWQTFLTKQIHPLLNFLWRELKQNWAVVMAFPQDINSVMKEVIEKWKDKYWHQIKDKTPWLLILDTDFRNFDIEKNEYLYISFRSFMDEYGKFRIFEIKTLLNLIIELSQWDNLFVNLKSYFKKENAKLNTSKILDLKPGIFWCSIDLEEALKVFINMTKK